MTASPTARTLEALRRAGFVAGVVERWNAHTRTRQDLFGFLDLVAVRGDVPGVLGVQATSGANGASRIAKILEEPRALVWVSAGNAVQVWSWRKILVGRRRRWSARIVPIELAGRRLEAGPAVESLELQA